MIRFVLAVAAVAAAVPAYSLPVPLPLSVTAGVTGGTLGIGPELGVRGTMLGVRGNATFLGLSHHFTSDDLRYDAHAHLQSYGAMIDLFPFGGGFRLSGGVRVNRNRARVIAMPTSDTSVGGQTFTPAQIGTLSGIGRVRRIAPTATIGYGSNRRLGFFWGVEGGALFQGRIRISDFTSSTGMIPQARIEAERASVQHDVDDYRVYPIAQVSLGWRF